MTSKRKPLLEKLAKRIKGEEHLELEFKKARGGLPSSVWETISAFANTNGGWIVLGVDEEAGKIVGVKNPKKMLANLHSLFRNDQKISYPACGANDIDIEKVENKPLIMMRVPEVSRRHRPVYINGNPYDGTYVRRNEGDYHCSKQEVDRMMREASADSEDSTILDSLGWDDLDDDAVVRYRQRFQSQKPGSAWNGYDDERFLRAIGAVAREPHEGREGLTVAGLLMLGHGEDISAWRPRHLIDYREIPSDPGESERWEDRITWEGNLLGAFEEIFPRLSADLPVKFRLESRSGTRVDESPVQVVLREALINLLAHADYSEAQTSLIKRSEEGFLFRNPGSSLVPKEDLLSGDRSEPRNPNIVKMFRYIGLAEEAGTGISQIIHLWRSQGLEMPRIDPGTERYEFALELRYSHLLSEDDRKWLNGLGRDGWTEAEQLALVSARHDGEIRNEKLRKLTGEHRADVTKILGNLRDEGYLEKKGYGKGAYYILGEKAAAERAQPKLELEETSTPEAGCEQESDEIDESSKEIIGDSERGTEDSTDGKEAQLRRLAKPAREKARLRPEKLKNTILLLCSRTPLSVSELADLLKRSKHHLRPQLRDLIQQDKLEYTHPESPRHPNQKYRVSGERIGKRDT